MNGKIRVSMRTVRPRKNQKLNVFTENDEFYYTMHYRKKRSIILFVKLRKQNRF